MSDLRRGSKGHTRLRFTSPRSAAWARFGTGVVSDRAHVTGFVGGGALGLWVVGAGLWVVGRLGGRCGWRWLGEGAVCWGLGEWFGGFVASSGWTGPECAAADGECPGNDDGVADDHGDGCVACCA